MNNIPAFGQTTLLPFPFLPVPPQPTPSPGAHRPLTPPTGFDSNRVTTQMQPGPQKKSTAQRLFEFSLLTERGAKSLLDIFRSYAVYVNGQISFAGQTMGNSVSERLKNIMHGAESPVTQILPERLRTTPLTQGDKRFGLELSARLDGYYGWAKLGGYTLALSAAILSLLKSRHIEDPLHKTNVIKKNLGLLALCGGFLAEKVGLIGVSFFVTRGQYDLAAMTLALSRATEIIGFGGAIYSAGPTIRDTKYLFAQSQISEEINKVLQETFINAEQLKTGGQHAEIDALKDAVTQRAAAVAQEISTKLSQAARVSIPLERSIVEKLWHPRDTYKTIRNKSQITAELLAIEDEIKGILDGFLTFAAQNMARMQSLKGQQDGEPQENMDAIKQRLKLVHHQEKLNLAEIGTANSRLYESIPRAIQSAAFLTMGTMAALSGKDPFEICQIFKGGHDLPLWVVGAIALVTATGPIKSLKKDIQERRRAMASGNHDNKLYATINATGNVIKIPGSLLVAHPITLPLGIAIYGGGVALESLGHLFPIIKKWGKSRANDSLKIA